MPDGQQYDLSTAARDPEFLKAGTNDKIAFLSAHDADFAKAPPSDKAGYINHLLGNDQETSFEKQGKMGPVGRQLTSLGLGAASGASGLPETLDPIGDALKAPPPPKTLGEAVTEGLKAGLGAGPSIYKAGKEILFPSGSGSDAAEERAHGFGTLAGQGGAVLLGEGVNRLGSSIKGAMPLSRSDRATQAYQQTIAPTSTKAVEQLDDMETFNRAKPYLSQQAKTNPVQATQSSGPLQGQPMGVMNLRQNAQAAAKTLYEKHLTPRINAYADAPVDAPGVANEIRQTINPDAPPDPAKNAAVEQLAKFYDRPMTVDESMRAIKALNEDKAVQGYEKAFPDKQIEMLRADPALEAKVKAANSLREKVFDSIEQHGSPEEANYIREGRKDYGALKQVANNLGNANVPTPQSLFTRTINTAKSLVKPDIGMVDTLFGNPNRLAAKTSKLLGRADLQPRQGPPIRENPWAPPNSSDPFQ